MSLSDRDLDPPEICDEHGYEKPCRACRLSQQDKYCDERYQDMVEGK